ncbi:hypothetical protein EDC04DRAFT_2616903 [Pisolithus marmoratus]|nr:hypothetical protein EDC04DRAFT_2616903 [Pisolithus marmoratus]
MSSPALEDDDFLQSFSILLTVYSKVKKTSAKGKMTSKEEKSTKMKELLFTLNSSNYIEFLQAILAGYEVTKKKQFPLKYIPSKAKGQCVSDAIDVENILDYREMVKKLTEDKPPMVKLFVDMQYIEKLPQGLRSKGSPGSSEDDLEASSNSNKGASARTKKANLDNCLAQWHLKLQKAYKNKHGEGLTYVSPLGSIPLMPAMIRDWCLALEDSQATIAMPPNIKSFNMENKAPILHPTCKATAQPAPPAMMDLNSLASVILLWTLTQLDSGVLHSPTALSASTPSPVVPPTPQTPTRQQVDTISSPLIPSLTQLVRYLQYVETNLGICNALSYKSPLEMHGIGPDNLPNVDNRLLADLGISAGNAIRLKKGSTAWWNGPDAKHKRSNASVSGHEPPLKRANTLVPEPHESA